MEFATFGRLPFEQFSAETSSPWLGNFSFSNISVEVFIFSISNQFKKPVPDLSGLYNGLFRANCPIRTCVFYLLFYDSSSANADPAADDF